MTLSMGSFSSMLAAGAGVPATWAQGSLESFIFRNRGQALHSQEADKLFLGIFWGSTIVFIILMSMMIYWVIKYRRRPGTIAPPSSSHNTPLEIAWTVIPLAFLAVIFFYGFHGYIARLVAPADAIQLELTGRKWNWSVKYPNGAESSVTETVGASNVPVFVVPADRPVKLLMKSVDVIHSFWVPDFRVKMDVIPNRYTSYWFQADAPANGVSEDHWVFCAEYCGDLHSEMAAIIRVVPENVYLETLNKWATPSNPVDLGKKLYITKGCVACHSVDGGKNTGPTWKDVYGEPVEFTDGSSLSAEQMTDEGFANYIRESILVPAKKIVKGYPNQMNSFQGQITEDEISGIIAYMKSLSAKGGEKK